MLDEGTRVAFELTANDRPGLIEELTGALAQLKVNVIELHTTAESAPMATEMLFVAQFDVALPGRSMKKRSRLGLSSSQTIS